VRLAHLTIHHSPLDTRILAKEAMSLAAEGHDVHVIAPGETPHDHGGVTFHAIPTRQDLAAPLRTPARLSDAWTAVRRLAPDAVHFHDPALIPVGLALRAAGVSVVYDVHEDHPREARSMFEGRPLRGRLQSLVFSALESLARRFLDRFVCATPEIARHFPVDRTILVRNYVRCDQLREAFAHRPPTPYHERPPSALYAGGITEMRGALEMVEAIHLQEVGVELELFGKVDSEELAIRLQDHPGWKHVRHHGFRPHQEVLEALGQVRLGMLVLHPHPMFLDALPIKLFEYMAAGLPVVASDFPLWRSIVEETGCGVLVDPLDPHAIAAAVTELIADTAEAQATGERGRESVLGRYEWSGEAPRLLELYAELEAGQRSSTG
jgi:glycosyltransferase involved in cell wall biosynthesis